MKKASFISLIMIFILDHFCSGRAPEYPSGSKPAPANSPGVEFPGIDSQL